MHYLWNFQYKYSEVRSYLIFLLNIYGVGLWATQRPPVIVIVRCKLVYGQTRSQADLFSDTLVQARGDDATSPGNVKHKLVYGQTCLVTHWFQREGVTGDDATSPGNSHCQVQTRSQADLFLEALCLW